MKFKMFTGLKATEVESQINTWLEQEGARVVTSGCSSLTIPGPFVNVSSFMVTVFFEERGT